MEKPTSSDSTMHANFDVVIVGAGVSGINAAYRVQHKAPPGTSFIVFEGRETIGGTWDLFRYPGIRSDSEVFTYSFSWNPWLRRDALATGPEIKNYVVESAKKAGIDAHIHYRHKVVAANWNPRIKLWELHVQVGTTTEDAQASSMLVRSRFLFLGTGFYDYDQPLQTVIPGIDNFQGTVIHPQFWPEDYDYADKEMVIIGSGATTISIVPAVTEKVTHVTMLQRSPTYYFPLSQRGKIARLIFALFPEGTAHKINRRRWILQAYLLVSLCNKFPGLSKQVLKFLTKRQLPSNVSWDKDFNPRYNPWEQRLCATMDGDFFKALKSGKASVVTDHIESVTKAGILLQSGTTLNADVIVTATGLKIKFGGDIRFSIADKPIDLSQRFVWKSCMLQDLPNTVFAIGYEDSTWTPGADCAAQLLVRLMHELQKNNASVATPHLEAEEEKHMEPKPLFSLSSTYVKDMVKVFPKGSGTGQWRPRSHYMADAWAAKRGDIKRGLVMS